MTSSAGDFFQKTTNAFEREKRGRATTAGGGGEGGGAEEARRKTASRGQVSVYLFFSTCYRRVVACLLKASTAS